MGKREWLVIGAVALVCLFLSGAVYTFGTPTAPTAATAGSDAASPVGEVGAVDADTEVPPANPNSPLAIQIPGCVCHSDDPKLVEEHAAYRMNQCAGCHAGKTPTGK